MKIDPHLPDRAQTPEEKKAVLDALAKAWEAHPELRLSQLLVNALNPVKPNPEFYYTEDKVIQDALERFK